jgi:mannose/fructose/N-acetylgalactosamine-specific phosphotransferase system component IID
MYLIAIAWIYVVLMMAVAEAMSPQGTVLGAVFTFVLYGVAPLALLLYILGTPVRKKARRAAEAAELEALRASAAQADAGGQPAGDAVAAERKEA